MQQSEEGRRHHRPSPGSTGRRSCRKCNQRIQAVHRYVRMVWKLRGRKDPSINFSGRHSSPRSKIPNARTNNTGSSQRLDLHHPCHLTSSPNGSLWQQPKWAVAGWAQPRTGAKLANLATEHTTAASICCSLATPFSAPSGRESHREKKIRYIILSQGPGQP